MLDGRRYHVTVRADRVFLAVEVVGVTESLALCKVAVATGLGLKAGRPLPHVACDSGISAKRAIGVAGAVKIVGAGIFFAGAEQHYEAKRKN